MPGRESRRVSPGDSAQERRDDGECPGVCARVQGFDGNETSKSVVGKAQI